MNIDWNKVQADCPDENSKLSFMLEEIAHKLAPVDSPDDPAYPNHSDTNIYTVGFKACANHILNNPAEFGWVAQSDYDKLNEALKIALDEKNRNFTKYVESSKCLSQLQQENDQLREALEEIKIVGATPIGDDRVLEMYGRMYHLSVIALANTAALQTNKTT